MGIKLKIEFGTYEWGFQSGNPDPKYKLVKLEGVIVTIGVIFELGTGQKQEGQAD